MNPYAYDFTIFNEGMKSLGEGLGSLSVRKQVQDYLTKMYGAQDAAASANRDVANAPGETPEIPGGGSSPVYDVKQYNDARANPLASLFNPGGNPDNTAAANAALMAAKTAPDENSQFGANPQIEANRAVLQQKADEMNRQAAEATRIPANPLVAKGIMQNQQAQQGMRDLFLKNRFLNVMNDPNATPEQRRGAAMSMLSPEGYLANTMITPKERMMLQMEINKAGKDVTITAEPGTEYTDAGGRPYPTQPGKRYAGSYNPITGRTSIIGPAAETNAKYSPEQLQAIKLGNLKVPDKTPEQAGAEMDAISAREVSTKSQIYQNLGKALGRTLVPVEMTNPDGSKTTVIVDKTDPNNTKVVNAPGGTVPLQKGVNAMPTTVTEKLNQNQTLTNDFNILKDPRNAADLRAVTGLANGSFARLMSLTPTDMGGLTENQGRLLAKIQEIPQRYSLAIGGASSATDAKFKLDSAIADLRKNPAALAGALDSMQNSLDETRRMSVVQAQTNRQAVAPEHVQYLQRKGMLPGGNADHEAAADAFLKANGLK